MFLNKFEYFLILISFNISILLPSFYPIPSKIFFLSCFVDDGMRSPALTSLFKSVVSIFSHLMHSIASDDSIFKCSREFIFGHIRGCSLMREVTSVKQIPIHTNCGHKTGCGHPVEGPFGVGTTA